MKKFTYISLFSSAGVGCYGFKQENFECIATCELLEKRMQIQRFNEKCKSEDQYIVGDLTSKDVHDKLISIIKKHNLINEIDVLIATPPCQGMSVANQKKKTNEILRNSLVVSAINYIHEINPKIFIFENVRSFLKTNCVGIDGNQRTIEEEISKELSKNYVFSSKILNFKDYGNNSSRTRTIVIGIQKKYGNIVQPYELFPDRKKGKTLKQAIGKYQSLNEMSEFIEDNPLHYFKPYEERMRDWIHNLKEGQSAFDNEDEYLIPNRIVNGKIIQYKNGFGDKYKRLIWNKECPCIHTANGCLASQNTIHPKDDRVLSVTELMEVMTIPKKFKWTNINLSGLTHEQKLDWIKKNDDNIRQAIGEAVPTSIFRSIAKKIKNVLSTDDSFFKHIFKYQDENPNKDSNAAFYTDKSLMSYIYNSLPELKKDYLKIVEPSVGMGSFLPMLFKKYDYVEKVDLFLIDKDDNSLNQLKINLKDKIPNNFYIHFIHSTFQNYAESLSRKSVDLIIGNPPFIKTLNERFNNSFEEFWFLSLEKAKNVFFISPKYLLSSPIYKELRNKLIKEKINTIIDFGENGFSEVKIETIGILATQNKPKKIRIFSLILSNEFFQNANYIFDKKLPFWLIYRNKKFDRVWNNLNNDIFNFKKIYFSKKDFPISHVKKDDFIQIIRSKNLGIKNYKLEQIDNYDIFVPKINLLEDKNFIQFNKNISEIFLIPNLTYYPRVYRATDLLKDDFFVNSSVYIATLKKQIEITRDDLNYFFTDEFREYYKIGFNLATRTLNLDIGTIKFYGIRKKN